MNSKTRLSLGVLLLLLPWITINAQNTGVDLRSTRKLAGWELYLGTYDYDENVGEEGDYVYSWKKVTETEAAKDERIMWSGDVESLDPIIKCDDFYKSPDRKSPYIQIGKNQGYAEGRNSSSAYAEKMVYDFTVTPNSTLLSFKYACVLHVPTSDDHTSYQMPAYEFSVSVTSPEGEKAGLLCSDFTAGANFQDKSFKRNDPNCTASLIEKNQNREDYIYKPWTTVCHDLTPYIGWNVHIEVIVHDCLVLYGTNKGKNKVENGGSHKAYGYFWAQTSKFELVPKNCGTDDATITAPEGFDEYKWTCRETKESLRTLPGQPNVALVPRGAIVDGAHYVCDMVGSNSSCTNLSLDTVLHTIDLAADFKYDNICDQTIQFTDQVEVNRDTIRNYEWDFGDGIVSVAQNPKHIYDEPGLYPVALKVTTGNGCTQTVTRNVTVETTPFLKVDGNQNVCQGDNVVLSILSSAIGKEYFWLDQNNDTISRSISMTMKAETSQPYRAYVLDRNNCLYYKDLYVSVTPSPTIFIRGDTSVCFNVPAKLWAWGDADTYSWSVGSDKDTIHIVPQRSETYQVTGSDTTSGCSTSKTFRLVVNPLPEVSIKGVESVCAGDPAKLSASGASKYTWSAPSLDAPVIGDTLLGYPLVTTTYTVMATDTNGCSNQKSYTVVVSEKPNLVVHGNQSVCAGEQLNLWVEGARSFLWDDGSEASSVTRTPSLNTSSYWVDGKIDGCAAHLEIPIEVHPVPNLFVNGNVELCSGDTLNLTASGADSYLWNGIVTGENFQLVTTMPTVSNVPSTVVVVGKNEYGCTNSIVKNYVVRSKPVVTIEGFKTACENSNVVLSATGTGIVRYQWSTGESNSVITTPVVSSNVTVDLTAWDVSGCYNTTQHTIRAVPSPQVKCLGNEPVCRGEELILVAEGASNFSWVRNDSVIEQGERLVLFPKEDQLVTLVGSSNNCESSLDVYVKVKEIPNLNVLGHQKVCRGDVVNLTATGADSYEWSTGDNTASISCQVFTNAMYMVKGMLNNGCFLRKNINVDVYRDLSVSLEEIDKRGCPGAPTTVTVGASGGVVYTWSSEPYNLTISGTTSYDIDALITEPTYVYVVGTDEHGCHGSDTLLIEPKESGNVTFQILPAILEKSDRTIHCDGFEPKNATWTWKMGDGSELLEGKNVAHTYSELDVVTEDSFKVVAKAVDEEGCTYESAKYVYVWKDFWAPTVFSPNGDGLNDKFSFLGGEYIDDFQFVIYNRLGQIVFEGHSIEDEWDGTNKNGDPCPQEIYGWSVTYKSDYKGIGRQEEKKGFITILK